MKKKNLVLTITIGDDYKKISKITHPTIKKYAKKIKADFLCIDSVKISKTTPHWEKFQIFDLLNHYERIIYLDTDLIVRSDCPNLFEIVPDYALGMFNEARFTDRSKEMMIDICKSYDKKIPGWNGKYYNSGVIVLSKQHKELFKKPDLEIFNFYEQSYLNMIIAEKTVIMHDLHYSFNRMTCLDRFIGEDRHASYIIHYAGYPNINFLLDLIPMDLNKWKKDSEKYNYKKHIHIIVNGGLGDQLCAEPVIRYMKKNLYPDDEIVVTSNWPRIFEHLKKIDIKVGNYGENCLDIDTPYYTTRSLPGPDTITWSVVSNMLCHTVDYISMSLIKRTLPIVDKQSFFEVSNDDLANMSRLIPEKDFGKLVLVHAGKHWDSKTFPPKWWQSVIDGLSRKGLIVCLIGKTQPGDPPDYIEGARGTVDVRCPKNGYDMRNLLTLGELAALISKTNVLISNDSAPIHLAGSFDNWIILIPSCKHPDHILPNRNNSIYYKTKALYKKLILNEIESRPTFIYSSSVDVEVKDWNKYLPTANDVINNALELYGI